MAEQYDAHDDDETTGDDLIKDLRRQIRALTKENITLTTELTSVKSGLRERTVAEILTAKGVNPKVSRFIPSDVEGEENIGKWLEENADVFSGLQATTPTEPTQTPEQTTEARRLQALGATAKVPAAVVADLQSRLAAATTQEEIDQIWAEGQKTLL